MGEKGGLLQGDVGEQAFSGTLAAMSVADLAQSLDVGRKSGAVNLRAPDGRSGTMWFRDGRVVDCAVDRLVGEPAFYRMLTWRDGQFEVDFGPVDRPDRISAATSVLLMEGTRRADELRALLGRLPPLDATPRIDFRSLSERLAEIPDEVNAILRLVDGRRTLAEVVDASEYDDLATASTLSRLWEERIVAVPEVVSAATVPAATEVAVAAKRAEAAALSPAEPAPAVEPPTTPAVPHAAADLPGPVEPPAAAGEPADEVPVAEPPACAPEEHPPRIVRFAPRARPLGDPRHGRPTETPALTEDVVPATDVAAQGVQPAASATEPASAPRAARARAAAVLAALGLVVLGAAGVVLSRVTAPAPSPAPRHPVPSAAPATTAGVSPAPVPAAPDPSSPAAAAPEPSPPATAAPADPDEYERVYAAARTEYAAGQLGAAIAHFRRALELRETSAARAGLGLALQGDNQAAAAVTELRRAIELDAANAIAYMALGRIYRAEDRVPEARAAFERYLELQPDGSDAPEARAALAGRP